MHKKGEGCESSKYQQQQVSTLDAALGRLELKGIMPGVPGYDEIAKLRGKLLSQMGFRVPRSTLSIIQLVGLSPGEIRVWFDVELGWISEARERAGALPVLKIISDDVAAALIKGELTHELEKELLTPDTYVGE